MPKPRFVTFDVYGTLLQWDQAVRGALKVLLDHHGRVDIDLLLACDAFEAESRRLQTVGAFRSFRGILRQSLRPACATAGFEPTAEEVDLVISMISGLEPFPEVPTVLADLADRYDLAPISNTDDDLLDDALGSLGRWFTTRVTAEQATAYKPNPGLFTFALEKLDARPDEVLHVAQGTFSDLAVCTALNIPHVWVNRLSTSLQTGLKPLAVLDDLVDLPALIASL